MIPKITLEQWSAFRAVVEEGSYGKAAEVLNKSQSTVSYAIARLNEQLPGPVLQPVGRKAELTDLGSTLYRHACTILDQAYATERLAQSMIDGWESQLVIAADALTPMPHLFRALQQFSYECQSTRIKILETSLSGTDEALFSRSCNIALTPRVPPGFLADRLATVTMIPVAHRNHPLAAKTVITEQQLKNERQIVVRDSGTKREQDAGWLGAEQRWTVSHFASSIQAIKAGLGFGFIPDHRIQEDLQSGDLVKLQLEWGATRQIDLHLILNQPQQSGPAALRLAQILKQQFRSIG